MKIFVLLFFSFNLITKTNIIYSDDLNVNLYVGNISPYNNPTETYRLKENLN